MKILTRKIINPCLISILLGMLSYIGNFFVNVFPSTQTEVKLLDEKYNELGSDIREIKENQKQFTKDQKYLIKFLLENNNGRKNKQDD